MKILFICDWDQAYTSQRVAERLKASGFATECVALVIGKIYYEELLRTNSGVFERIYLMQEGTERLPELIENLDGRLAAIERRYPEHPLWRYVWADRSWVRCGYDEIRKRLVVCFEYFEELYGREKPDLLLTNAFGSMPQLISQEVARKQGIPLIRPMALRLQDRYILSDNATEDVSWVTDYLTGRRPLSEAARAEVLQFLDEFRRHTERPAYLALRAKEHEVTAGHFYRFFRYIYRYWFTGAFKGEHSKANPFKRLRDDISWRVQRARFARAEQWDSYRTDEKYVYFPLHYQPEASTMSLAPFYLDQLNIIENLSKSLPIGYRLYVKEHSYMLGRRSAEYYARIKALANVRLVSPFTDSFEIIERSSLVFTITGTPGLEAMILKRPVVVLGAAYFRFCPLAVDASRTAPTDWPRLISELLANSHHNEETLVTFLGALFERGFRGTYVEPLASPDTVLAPDNLDRLAEQIVTFYRQLPAPGKTWEMEPTCDSNI